MSSDYQQHADPGDIRSCDVALLFRRLYVQPPQPPSLLALLTARATAWAMQAIRAIRKALA